MTEEKPKWLTFENYTIINDTACIFDKNYDRGKV